MRVVLPVVLMALAPACSTAEPQKSEPSPLLVDAVTCKMSATKLAALSEPGSSMFKGAKLAESMLDAGVMVWSTGGSERQAADLLATDAVNQLVEGKTPEEATYALRVKVSDCLPPIPKDPKAAGEPGNG